MCYVRLPAALLRGVLFLVLLEGPHEQRIPAGVGAKRSGCECRLMVALCSQVYGLEVWGTQPRSLPPRRALGAQLHVELILGSDRWAGNPSAVPLCTVALATAKAIVMERKQYLRHKGSGVMSNEQ